MWFLLVKIFFLLCLAALLGAALAWWWMRRRFVDVTESHAELSTQVDSFLKQGKAMTRDDVEMSLATALAAYRPPQADLMPLQQKLIDIEQAMAAPDQDVYALHDRLNGLEQSVSAISASIASMRSVHLEAIDQQLRGVAARVDNLRMPDIDSVNSRIAALSSHVTESRAPDLRLSLEPRLERMESLLAQLRTRETDLGPVHSGLAALELAVENLELPAPNFAPLQLQLSGLQQRIDELSPRAELNRLSGEVGALTLAAKAREPDLDVVLQRVTGLEAAVREVQIPEPDLDPIVDLLAKMENRMAADPSGDVLLGSLAGIESDLDVLARRPVDLDPVYNQLSALDDSLAAMRAELRGTGRFDALDRRLAVLQESVLNLPQPDFSRIDSAVRSIESSVDLGALEDRLTAIEYGLTAVHHMLRSRGEASRVDPVQPLEPRPAPRPPRAAAEAVPRPARRADPISRARRADDEANLLTHAAFGAGDDLKQIIGIGPTLSDLLNEVGVYYFWQVAEWTQADIDYVDGKLLHFRGRIERDDWVGQSRAFAALSTSARRPSGD
jgi:predicted flap endonuclease-1-like 5' DNA nuclease